VNRKEALDNLRNEDPDYVVDVLRISSRELIKAFPSKVREYLDSEVESDSDEDDGYGG
jgi:hypothetical protein